MVLTGECKIGWYSEFHFTCGVCKIKETIESEDPNKSSKKVNVAVVTGAINSGQGYLQIEILTAVFKIPNMSNQLYLDSYFFVQIWINKSHRPLESPAKSNPKSKNKIFET